MARLDDPAIARLAGRQRGVVSVSQLHAAGFDNAAIKRRCRAGRLHRLRRGVYLVGPAVAPDGAAEVAALLACPPMSVVGHRSSARLWGLRSLREWNTPVEVTVVGSDPGRKRGIKVYRTAGLVPRDVRHIGGIPVTAPARTLLDLATVLPAMALEVAYADARTLGLLREADVAEVLERNRGRRGNRVLRAILETAAGAGLTRSQAEQRMLALIRAAALPAPKVNARLGRFVVDFLWPAAKVVVEVDGYTSHGGRTSFERDRERDATLLARGYVVLRVTWRQLVAQREAVVARVAAALSIHS
jgi:very-short-patch-repair endonuclease